MKGFLAIFRPDSVMMRGVAGSALSMLWIGAVFAQGAASPAPDAKAQEGVVPYCIEPMESMPEKILALIDSKLRCAPGTHLTRDNRPARVVPTGEESPERPFVLRFGPPETANAWFVRGYTTEGH